MVWEGEDGDIIRCWFEGVGEVGGGTFSCSTALILASRSCEKAGRLLKGRTLRFLKLTRGPKSCLRRPDCDSCHGSASMAVTSAASAVGVTKLCSSVIPLGTWTPGIAPP